MSGAVPHATPLVRPFAILAFMVFVVGLIVAMVAVRDPKSIALERTETGTPSRKRPSKSKLTAATASASVTPTISASVSSAPPEPKSTASAMPMTSSAARQAFEDLDRKYRTGDIKGAVAGVDKLIDVDRRAVEDAEVRARVLDIAVRAMFIQGHEPDFLFAWIRNRMGTTGIDMLYELVETRGGTKAAKMARRFLQDPAVAQKGTEALQVAWALRQAKTCGEVKTLFERVRTHGDGRSFSQLQVMAGKQCNRFARSCCLPDDEELEALLDALSQP